MPPNNTTIDTRPEVYDIINLKSETVTKTVDERSQSADIDVPDNGDDENLDMKIEADRLKTFERWPVSFISPSVLVKLGFYYMKVDDRVRCEFCKVEIDRWEQGDDPSIDHQRWAPNCPFLRNRPVGNVPIDPPSTSPRPGPSYDVCGPLTIRPNAVPENQNLGLPVTKGPEYPQYATEAARLRSYSQWPSSLKQRPGELSEAGFFYTGHEDRTLCFHCGGGLKDWEPEDAPWEQHARWFPTCVYVQLIKGKEFISKVAATMTAILTANEAQALETTPSIVSVAEPKADSVTPEPVVEKNDTMASTTPVSEDKLCKICYMEEKNAVFVPCGHVVSCIKCSLSVKACPVCQRPYTGVMRVFFS
ncbi:death-associated inhibitor of apoptosis 1-like [Ctenocephalides felis]|uniref:death-associated inhibitor of apoptosis 1-like n=1 Tax=Ctenocephalides felis TaxID=7515 RepID=UPI000E6E48C3|nr:death-associated inhibitor of apoptosis 1-like [Ctenocephalides felis]XP_026475716.1 death-associated inhibitor of apoptosis 1-like [Ctenocephalides felis]XP_026475728.1 death-associated inhibitor of apoptosis 1-like [Ctenocephalides felis]